MSDERICDHLAAATDLHTDEDGSEGS